jgi:hypothetical protein
MEETKAEHEDPRLTKPRTRYSEIEVGAEFAPAEWVVTEPQIDYFCEGNEDHHEWYSVESPWGGRIAPPLMNYRPARGRFSSMYNVRGLLYAYESEYLNPVRPNTIMRITGKITDKWLKNDKAFVAYEVTCEDEDGLPVFWTRRVHLLDSSD